MLGFVSFQIRKEPVMKIRLLFGIVVGVLVLSAAFAHAEDTGTITGTMHDNTGAIEYRFATLG